MSVMDVFRALRQAGMEEELASLVAQATDLGPVATKQDLADVQRQLTDVQRQLTDLKSDMAVVKSRVTGLYWLIGSMTVLLGLLQGMPLVLALLPS